MLVKIISPSMFRGDISVLFGGGGEKTAAPHPCLPNGPPVMASPSPSCVRDGMNDDVSGWGRVREGMCLCADNARARRALPSPAPYPEEPESLFLPLLEKEG